MDTLRQQLTEVDAASFESDDAGRQALLAEAQKLCRRLETPEESILRMTFQEPTLNLTLRIADELELFQQLGPVENPPKGVVALAEPTDAEPELVRRVLRHCAAHAVVREVSLDNYASTRLSELLSTRQGSAPLRCVANKYNPIFQHIPAYLKSNGFRVPRDSRDGPFQHSRLGTVGQTHFEWLEQPEAHEIAEDFNLLMQFGARSEGSRGQRSWVDALPMDPLLSDVNTTTAPVFVDVGGNLGHNSIVFRKRHADLGGRVIVQDLGPVIQQAKATDELPSDIEFMTHNFFEPQPMRNAKIYFMGHVLHDWPDLEARKILKNVVSAMKKDYSILILREKVLQSTGCDPLLCSIDIIMMAELASHERSSRQWSDLLTSEGLSLVNVHPIPGSQDSIILAESY